MGTERDGDALLLSAARAALAEIFEELAVGRQHHRRVVARQRVLIGLHRAVEGEEIRVLAVGRAESLGLLGVAAQRALFITTHCFFASVAGARVSDAGTSRRNTKRASKGVGASEKMSFGVRCNSTLKSILPGGSRVEP